MKKFIILLDSRYPACAGTGSAGMTDRLFLDSIPIRRIETFEISDKKIDHFPLSIFSSHAMASTGNKEKIEDFVGFDQCINYLHG